MRFLVLFSDRVMRATKGQADGHPFIIIDSCFVMIFGSDQGHMGRVGGQMESLSRGPWWQYRVESILGRKLNINLTKYIFMFIKVNKLFESGLDWL